MVFLTDSTRDHKARMNKAVQCTHGYPSRVRYRVGMSSEPEKAEKNKMRNEPAYQGVESHGTRLKRKAR